MKLELTTTFRKGAFVLALGLVVAATPRAQAQTFSVLHSFTGGSDGGTPLAGFAIDTAGTLYGTTSTGGASGIGTVFKISAEGTETVLHSFSSGTDGANPQGSLLRDAAGDLYGTTFGGGASGAGTVFKVGPHGKETVLYSFKAGTDGANPEAGLAIDAAGNLYGTTTAGGPNGNGTIFKLTKKPEKWTEKVLYSFGSGTDGAIPVAGVTLNAAGSLYGTTSAGGTYGYGTVFQLKDSKSGWKEDILHNFELQSDGGVPYAGLVFDQSGNLYGAATEGGDGGQIGGGTVFELTPTKGSWTFTVINSLAGWGISGTFRDLLLDSSGDIYATTHCDGANDAGTVYELTPSAGTWTYNSLYVFTGGSDGLFSFSNLVSDKNGNLYGTTRGGGTDGSGVVFKVEP
jgi:uncharacterized repeat protein (TIGR03803 family)